MGKQHDRMDHELRIRGYAEGTRKIYLQSMVGFVRHFMRSPDELTVEHVKQYQLYLTRDKRVSWSTFNVTVCAIRFFYREVLQVDWDIERIRYQKRGRKLPVVLSDEEICALLDATTNLKHRAVLMTLYSAGVRISEVLRLRPDHIDSARMMILVEDGKGKKDRYVMLSEQLLVTLRRYWLEYRPGHWLFPGQDPSRPITRAAINMVFNRSRKKAGIRKRASLHARSGTPLLPISSSAASTSE